MNYYLCGQPFGQISGQKFCSQGEKMETDKVFGAFFDGVSGFDIRLARLTRALTLMKGKQVILFDSDGLLVNTSITRGLFDFTESHGSGTIEIVLICDSVSTMMKVEDLRPIHYSVTYAETVPIEIGMMARSTLSNCHRTIVIVPQEIPE